MQGSSNSLKRLWKPWVMIAAVAAVLAVMAGVPPFFIAILAICPLMMAGMHGGQAGHDTDGPGHDTDEHAPVRSQPGGSLNSSLGEREDAQR